MRNIFRIIRDDFNSFRHNVIAWIVIIGLVALPSLYAWFNIAASWDPYSNTGNLDIAVANTDLGYDGDLLPVSINMGDNLVSSVCRNSSFNWIVTDEESAIEGVRSSDYYAAIVIPEDFSENMMSMFTGSVSKASIVYYSNEKENAIATKVTDKGASAVDQKIEDTFSATVAEIALNVIKDVAELEGDENATESTISTIISRINTSAAGIHALAATTESLSQTIGTLSELLEAATDSNVDTDAITAELRNKINKIDVTTDLDKVASITDGDLKKKLTKISTDLKTAKADTLTSLDNLDNASDKVDSSTATVIKDINKLCSTINSTADSLDGTYSELKGLADRLQAALDSGDMETIRAILGEDSSELSSFLATPVNLNTTKVYPVENYGSAMAPFYTSLAIWVGGTVLIAMMEVELSEERRKNMVKLRYYQEYFGRYLLFLIIGVLQALLVCAGDLWYLGIQCVHPGLFLLAGVVSSIVFVNLAYTLTASFGNVGKAICVILLVIQVAGSGGTFPIEMEPEIFQKIYPLLPFAHSMPAMREAIAGLYGNTYWMELGKLLMFLVYSLAFGLIFRLPLLKAGHKLEEKLSDVKIMG